MPNLIVTNASISGNLPSLLPAQVLGKGYAVRDAAPGLGECLIRLAPLRKTPRHRSFSCIPLEDLSLYKQQE